MEYNSFKPYKFSSCDHAKQLDILHKEIKSLQEFVANLRKDIPAILLQMLIEAEAEGEAIRSRYRHAGICKCGHHSSQHYLIHGDFNDCKMCCECEGFYE